MIKVEIFFSSSSGNLYLVENEDTKILLECGVDEDIIVRTLWKEEKTNLSKLNACLISHHHEDHCKSISYVNKYLPVYANERVYKKYPFKGFIIADNNNFKIGSIKIKAVDVKHGKTPNTAFIMRDKDNTIFFGTDFSHIESNLSSFKFDTIYIEINYIEDLLNTYLNETEDDDTYKAKFIRQINTHMNLKNAIEEVLKVWDLSKCKEIIAIHMSLDCGDREIIRNSIEKEFGIPCYVARPQGGY